MGLEGALPGGGGGNDDGDDWAGGFPEIVGSSPAAQALRKEMARLAPWDWTVHIHGETGAGKEVVARALHRRSPRARGPFVPINVAAVGDGFFDAELFGHARGAYTGATAAREGYIARANGGTLLIDEVGELSPQAQVKLLRFLQEREYYRLGESTPRKADVRVLSATNVDLERRVAEGHFRADLLYRLAAHTLGVPPLRERGRDIDLLARQLLEEAAAQARRPVPVLPDEVLEALRSYRWPGNVRQLQSEMERLLTRARGAGAQLHHLSPEVRLARPREPAPLRESVRDFTCELVRQALARHVTLASAAAELGISRQALYKKRRRYGV